MTVEEEAEPATALGALATLRDLFKGDRLASALARGSSQAFAISIASVVFGFATQWILARTLGTQSFGAYVYVTGWATTILLVVKLELDTVAVRFVSAYTEGRADPAKLKGLLRFLFSTGLGVSSLAGLIGAVALLVTPGALTSELGRAALVGSAMVPVMAVLMIAGGALQGHHRILQAQTPFYVVRPLVFVVALVAALALTRQGEGLTAPRALALNVFATILATMVSLRWLRQAVGRTSAQPTYARREWLRTGVGLLPASMAQQALGQTTDVILVGTMLSTSAAGIYSIAGQITMFVAFGIAAVATMAAPMIAALHERGDKSELRRLVVMVARVNLAYTIPAYVFLVVAGGWILSLFGPDFRSGYPILLVMGLRAVTAVIGGHAGTMLSMTGHQRDASIIIGTCAALNLALGVLMTLRFGVMGTATATLLATTVRNAWLPIVAGRRLGVSLRPW